MGAGMGNSTTDLEGWATPVDSVKSKPPLQSAIDDAEVGERQSDRNPQVAGAVDRELASRGPAAEKVAKQKPPVPAAHPPSRVRVAIPPELHREMHRVKNRWLQADDDRMDAFNKPLGVENTFMVTLLAFATATLKAELEKDGGATTTFPDYIPVKPKAEG